MKYKPYLVLGILFVLGMMLGGMIVAKIAQQQIEQAKQFITPDGFVQQLSSLLEPENKLQLAEIEHILLPAGEKMHENVAYSRQQMRLIMDDVQVKLKNILTIEQYNRLIDKREKFKIQEKQP